jgi:hypothetical protein
MGTAGLMRLLLLLRLGHEALDPDSSPAELLSPSLLLSSPLSLSPLLLQL